MNRTVKFILLSLLILLPLSVSAQILIQKEEIAGTRYRLSYGNQGYPYTVQNAAGKKILSFTGPVSTADDARYPTRDLFIALPPNTHPSVQLVVTNRQPLAADGIVNLPEQREPYWKNRGYLWLGGYYCMHISLDPFWYDASAGKIMEVREFYIDAGVPAAAAAAVQGLPLPVPDAVENVRFAGRWAAQRSGAAVSQADSWIDYSQEYLKLGTARDGIYRLTYGDLMAYGIPVGSLNPRSFKLYLRGKEIPIYVRGENDNSFNAGDYVEFLGRRNYGDANYRDIAETGTSYHEYLNRYSDTTIYWLAWNGSVGKRVDTTLAVSGAAADTTKYYDELVHSETDLYWDFALSGGDVRRNSPELYENETWNDGTLGVGKLPIGFSVSNLAAGKPARAFVKFGDYSSNIDVNAHDLSLSINANPTTYDSGYTNKFQGKVLKADFSSSVLSNGSNTVNINSYPTQNTINVVIRDWYELEYPRLLIAAADSLQFSYRNPVPSKVSVIAVSGLTPAPVALYKFRIADSATIKITNFTRGTESLRFTDTVAAGTSYFLLGENKIAAPIVFYKKKFIDLRSAANRAEYIAITHPYFSSAAAAYLSFIASTYKVTTKLVSVNDIYDEYNYGFLAPEPIRDFLQSASVNWQTPKPKYVFLIGKGTYDYYGNKTRNFGVPPIRNFVPSYGNPVSDTWFTIWDSTGSMIPQMSIGRIPAKTIDEFQFYFSKHQKYVSKGYDEWNKRYLFFAGGNFTDPAQIAQSKSVNDYIINNFVAKPPIGGTSANFYKTADPVSNFGPYSPEYIKDAIDQGGVFISYIGHSGTQTWDNSITDVTQLTNIRDRNPLITDFGCSTGKFAEPDVFSFSELAVNDVKGQAIEYIGNSSLGFTTTAYSFPQVFYKKLLVDTLVSVGETHLLAKIDYLRQYGTSSVFGLFVLTNTLIGDPIVKLPIPPKVNLTVANTSIAVTPSRPTEQTDTIRVGFSYNNFGKVTGDSADTQITDEFKSKVIFSRIVRRKVPLFIDSLFVSIPIRSMPGEHILSIRIDPSGRLDEITTSDNILTSTVVVASSNTRNLSIAPTANQTTGELTFLNPSVKTTDTKFMVDVSPNSSFAPKQTTSVPFDTFYTRYKLDGALSGKRLWVRTKNESQSVEGLTYSYVFGNADNYFINDSTSFARVVSNNMKVIADRLILDTTQILFSAISAGLSDGRTAVITKNGQNFIPENTVRGHHVVLFDASTFEYAGYYRFDVLAGGAEVSRYKTFLDTLTSRFIIVIAISDEGSGNVDAALKSSIRQLGSRYIDSVGYRYSWAIIGRKGAAPGTVPEKFSKPFDGRVQIDSTINIPNMRGTFETEPIGPVAAWKNVELHYAKPAGGTIGVSVVGIRANNSTDTLKSTVLADSTIDLADINAQLYPAIKILGELGRASGQLSPWIGSIAVNYDQLAELGTNYQAVHAFLFENGVQGKEIAAGDSVMQGQKVLLKYRVYNAGGVPAKKIGALSAAVWDNTNNEPIANGVIDSLPPRSYRELSGVYNTALGYGRRSLRITIDPDTLIRELFKDNNIYALPIYVKKDSSKPLLPNLYVSQKDIFPLVSPVTDEKDSARFGIVYGNSGAYVNDSVTISIRQFYKDANVDSWTIRRKYPPESDTVYINVPILKRAGDHLIQVELDPVGLIVESSETDNTASYYFTVVTTDFKILQPTSFSACAFSTMIFLNPTSSSSAAVRIVDLELDTLENYSTARKVQLPMQEFTTTYDIGQLPGSSRYYWRIRRQQSGNGWTQGSFYLGTSAVYTIGQTDSTAWKANAYVHAAYGADGAFVVNTVNRIRAVSAGYSDGRTGSIEVNGANVLSPVFGTGHNVVVLDTSTYAVAARRRFDISNNADESDSLAQFISSVAPGLIVADVVVDEGANNLTQSARDALKSIGSASIDKLAWRDSWAIIGRKGAAMGGVPEAYVPQFGGSAAVEIAFLKEEYRGTIATQAFGPLSAISGFSMSGTIPAGTSVQATFVGIRYNNSADTVLLTSGSALSNSQIQNSAGYKEGKILFDMLTSGKATPRITAWKLTALPAKELAVSERTVSVNRPQVMEGEPILFTGKVYNVGSVPAESVSVQLSTNEGGFDKILKTQQYALIAANDSASFSYAYATKGKKGSHAFVLKIDPQENVIEQSKDNNSAAIPFTVQADSLRPELQVDIDGIRVVNGDYVSRHPVVAIRFSDNNPSVINREDSSNFTIRLNNTPVYFTSGIIDMITTSTPGAVQLNWTPELPDGENIMQIFANDVSGNASDTTLLFVNVSSNFVLADVYNLPNPFAGSTHFTFNVLGPVNPDDVSIKIFTVAGRLIQDIPYPCTIGFNKIYWDGRDRDGDEIANGVYFYKVIVKQGDAQTSAVSKLVKMK